MHLTWPWNDRAGRFSPLKALTFFVMFLPAIWLVYQVEAGNFDQLDAFAGDVKLALKFFWFHSGRTRD